GDRARVVRSRIPYPCTPRRAQRVRTLLIEPGPRAGRTVLGPGRRGRDAAAPPLARRGGGAPLRARRRAGGPGGTRQTAGRDRSRGPRHRRPRDRRETRDLATVAAHG